VNRPALLRWIQLIALGISITTVLAAVSVRSADRACVAGADCRDGNPCTLDICNSAGTCQNLMPPTSAPMQTGGELLTPHCNVCDTDADCDDRNPCTTEICGSDGSCEVNALPGCVRCFQQIGAPVPLSCHEGDPCTVDSCIDGVCVHTPTDQCALCEPAMEMCADGGDDDCDGLIDCADPDCAMAARCAPGPEICGDCIDNDGDELVDYEDADCCGEEIVLGINRMMLRPTANVVRQDKLRLTTTYSRVTPPNFDPRSQDTTLQISDRFGQLFCATVTADHWMPMGPRTVTFWDAEGRYAGGLADGRITIKRNGRIRFAANGRRMPLRLTDGRDVRITVRVGERCSRSSATLRGQAASLVFP